MRKIAITLALAGTALALSACSQEAEEVAETADAAQPEAGAAATTGVLDASTATAEELGAVAGVTPELAAAIVAGQPYASVTDFNAVLMGALSAEEAAAVRAKVFVPVNLNSATTEELELIPGIDGRMVHEFEEYMPYDDMAEFNREIGKYVDEAEVARYRQYVTL